MIIRSRSRTLEKLISTGLRIRESGRVTTAAKLHAAKLPLSAIGRPDGPYSCHASELPFSQPVPSVHARSTSPFFIDGNTWVLAALSRCSKSEWQGLG
jgi:hypothetical protein